MEPAFRGEAKAFSIEEGGPFYGLLRRLRLLRFVGAIPLRVWWIVVIAIAWLPLILGAALRWVFGVNQDPIIFDISVHTRFVVGLPLLIAAAHMLEPQCRGAVNQLYQGKLADPAALDPVIDRAQRLRDSVWVEGPLLVIAASLGQLVLWGVVGPTGVVYGISHHASWSFARIWYASLSLPLVQFLTLRWLWRWTVWNYLLVRVSRLPLAATATHPDRSGGLGFLSWPIGGYTWFVAAISSVLAGAWGTQLIDKRATIPSLAPTLVGFIVLAWLVGCAPLLMFSSQVYRARRRDLAAYSLFNLDYVRQFRAKWIDGTPAEPLLGSADIRSLNHLGNAFQMILTTRVWLFQPRLRTILFAALIPMLPLLATLVPVESILHRLLTVVLGGLAV